MSRERPGQATGGEKEQHRLLPEEKPSSRSSGRSQGKLGLTEKAVRWLTFSPSMSG